MLREIETKKSPSWNIQNVVCHSTETFVMEQKIEEQIDDCGADLDYESAEKVSKRIAFLIKNLEL